MFVEVALPIPALPPLTYRLADETQAAPGMRVVVPLGKRTENGVVIKVLEQTREKIRNLKDVTKILDQTPAFSEELLSLGEWMAGYYQCSWGEVLAAMAPAWLPERKRAANASKRREYDEGPEKAFTLTRNQQAAATAIQKALGRQAYEAFLLHGVTGSGKTEVYLQAIAAALENGRGAIMLVPEIALAPQIRARIAARFPDQVAVLHSGLGARERSEAWGRLRQGSARVALGARSAVFAPVRDLGLIVVDEEYEGSYKQEDVPRYQARDVAAVRAQRNRAVLVLGSATPAVESYHNALSGRYQLLSLPERVDSKRLPRVRIIDRGEELRQNGRLPIFSLELLTALEDRLTRGEQSILFLNRRGFAPWVMCPACRHVLMCPDCSVSLVYHQAADRLGCHSCGRFFPARPACPQCGTACVRLAGAGTERVETELRQLLPAGRVLRMDQDSVRRAGALEQKLEEFRQGRADILVGTQMVAKGMDFPGVTLVGVISADTALNLPDFRAEERTFQLLVQVAGRSGRGGQPGLVLVQTMNPGHPVMALAQSQDYAAFYAREIGQRRELDYPPFMRLAKVICRSENAGAAQKAADQAARALAAAAGPKDAVLGPALSGREKIARETRYQILIKSPDYKARARLLEHLKNLKLLSNVKMSIDVDPQNMM